MHNWESITTYSLRVYLDDVFELNVIDHTHFMTFIQSLEVDCCIQNICRLSKFVAYKCRLFTTVLSYSKIQEMHEYRRFITEREKLRYQNIIILSQFY